MLAVHFGAGNIGRGFIGQILARSGYEICFVDVSDALVELLRSRKEYRVTLAEEGGESVLVRGVTAVNGKDAAAVSSAVASAALVTTAVGVNVLPHIAAAIAQGLRQRMLRKSPRLPVIACENAIGASTRLKEHVYSHLNPKEKEQADRFAVFPDAAVDRIVPLQKQGEPLEVTVEPFYEWVIDRSVLEEEVPPLSGVHFVEKLEPYIERKLFTVNTGHCAAAYLGFLRGCRTIQEAMADEWVAGLVPAVLGETGAVLVRKFGFPAEEHERYVRDILDRFRNPYLTDEVIRVGRSPIRKLSPGDRLAKPAREAAGYGIEPKHLALVMAAAFRFDVPEDPESVQLRKTVAECGLERAIERYTGFAGSDPVHRLIREADERLQHVHPVSR
jgi:mannitol-1-phosphate 5-dehydrogenase